MSVKRIVTNVATEQVGRASTFYADILGLHLVMDQGWIRTYAGEGTTAPQISFASEGGSGTDVPDLSIEVDNLDEIHQRLIDANIPIEYGPVTEPWGLRRLYVRDPFGKLLNVLEHGR